MLEEIFKVEKPIIGVIHLKPLIGSPNYEGNFDEILSSALKDARSLIEGGVDGLLIENYGDMPYLKNNVEEHTIASMGIIAWEIKKAFKLPIGINVLRNASKAALAIASVINASFIRVNVYAYPMITDQGIIEPNAGELLRYRNFLHSNVKIFADVMVKHAFPLVDMKIERVARDTYLRAKADALILTGEETGKSPDMMLIKNVRKAVDAPILAGSGVNIENILEIIKLADGAIIGTYFKKNGIIGNEVDVERVKRLMDIVKKFRERNR